MVCEPMGSFLIDQFAPKLLTIAKDDPAYEASQIEDDGKKETVKEKENDNQKSTDSVTAKVGAEDPNQLEVKENKQ